MNIEKYQELINSSDVEVVITGLELILQDKLHILDPEAFRDIQYSLSHPSAFYGDPRYVTLYGKFELIQRQSNSELFAKQQNMTNEMADMMIHINHLEVEMNMLKDELSRCIKDVAVVR